MGADVKKRRLYLLQNRSAGYLGNSPVFWANGGGGYTQWIDEAKRWTLVEAQKQIDATRSSHDFRAIPLDEIERVAKRTVDMQDLRRC